MKRCWLLGIALLGCQLHSAQDQMVPVRLQYGGTVHQTAYPLQELTKFITLKHMIEDVGSDGVGEGQPLSVALLKATRQDFEMLLRMANTKNDTCPKELPDAVRENPERLVNVYALLNFLDPEEKKTYYPLTLAVLAHLKTLSKEPVNAQNPRDTFLRDVVGLDKTTLIAENFLELVTDQRVTKDNDALTLAWRTFIETPYIVGSATNGNVKVFLQSIKKQAREEFNDPTLLDRIEKRVVRFGMSLDQCIVPGTGVGARPTVDRVTLSIQDLVDAHVELGRGWNSLYIDNKNLTLLDGLQDVGDLVTLQKLYLSGNKIRALPARAFDQLAGLQVLDLSRNHIRELPAGLFDPLTALQNLYLSRNHIRELPAGLFDKLTGLRQLYLFDNQIRVLPAGVFNRLTGLLELLLFGNQIDEQYNQETIRNNNPALPATCDIR